MDRFSYSWYQLKFNYEYISKRGTEFQKIFACIMELAYPEDFVPVRPWGNIGDQKNDGYLKSRRQLFQVYAPNELERAETEKKMDEDFNGALPHWKRYFDIWTFVHNTMPGMGIPPFVNRKLLEFEEAHPHITCNQWGCSALKEVLFRLPEGKIAEILGWCPSRSDTLDIGYADVQEVLDHVAQQPADPEADLRVISADKLKINSFSPEVESFLRLGLRRSRIVQKLFEQNSSDPTHGDRIAKAFGEEYKRLKADGNDPDAIFFGLQGFVVGPTFPDHRRQSTVLAVLAHLFESCDIFERPPDAL